MTWLKLFLYWPLISFAFALFLEFLFSLRSWYLSRVLSRASVLVASQK